ncbi:hypothetical protein Daus18300_013819 [Diaporthe australafricana]|uniref:Uncharacterized protein n=1 Tax=Diaporthe australafricana TaxID=127596 RepID=A0ABR3VXL8_9PEZI
MAPEKKKSILGDARDEMDPKERAEKDRQWKAKNLDASRPNTLGASRWNPNPAASAPASAPAPASVPAPAAPERMVWRLGQSREDIFAIMEKMAGAGRFTARYMEDAVAVARWRLYQTLYQAGVIQSETSEQFPWDWPQLFQGDQGYAAFVKSAREAEEPEAEIEKREQAAKERAMRKDTSGAQSTPAAETDKPSGKGEDGKAPSTT